MARLGRSQPFRWRLRKAALASVVAVAVGSAAGTSSVSAVGRARGCRLRRLWRCGGIRHWPGHGTVGRKRSGAATVVGLSTAGQGVGASSGASARPRSVWQGPSRRRLIGYRNSLRYWQVQRRWSWRLPRDFATAGGVGGATSVASGSGAGTSDGAAVGRSIHVASGSASGAATVGGPPSLEPA